MKPTRNKVFCKDCERAKILFETEKKANNFIKFNTEEIEEESGYGPQRSYYCLFCGGWHITSIKVKIGLSRKEQKFEQYKQDNPTINRNGKVDNQAKRIRMIENWERQIKDLDTTQKEKFFSENAGHLFKEIELLQNTNIEAEKNRLKELRKNLEILNFVKNRNGFHKENEKLEKRIKEAEAKKMEEWRLWYKELGY